MTDEEREAEEREAERLIRQIQELNARIHEELRRHEEFEDELDVLTDNVCTVINKAEAMDSAVNADMERLSTRVAQASIETAEVFRALNELSNSYFIFKNLSTASKNLTQFNDEYYTRFGYYHDLRRITLGYVVGLDAHICSSETLRKKVEKIYLQNTEYWLAYAIAAVMLWASDEHEAAERAVKQALGMHFNNACLFFLLVNLRFNRIPVARNWYLNYLSRVDSRNLGDEWQYLLEAYLKGALGSDEEMQTAVRNSFREMLEKAQAACVDFSQQVSKRAQNSAQTFLHKSEAAYIILRDVCEDYPLLHELISTAEKNELLAARYQQMAEMPDEISNDLAQRIENVLYSLINSYEPSEYEVLKKIRYNEAIVAAKGDITAAQAKYEQSFANEKKRKAMTDLLMAWAFADPGTGVPASVQKFSITYLKDWICAGFAEFVSVYRHKEPQQCTFTIDGCTLRCSEEEAPQEEAALVEYYEKGKWGDTLKDTFILIYIAVCFASLLTLVITAVKFMAGGLVVGILLGLGGSFLLWRRIVDMQKILQEKQRLGILKFRQAIAELRQWREVYRAADANAEDLLAAVERY